jgi:hypothetical protein
MKTAHGPMNPVILAKLGRCYEQRGRNALWRWLPVGENGSGRGLVHILVSFCFPLERFV